MSIGNDPSRNPALRRLQRPGDLVGRAGQANSGSDLVFPSVGAKAPETMMGRWDRLYQPLLEIRKMFKPAYLDAVLPFMAAAALIRGANPVRVLVVGGGDGHFSREVLPSLRDFLQRSTSSLSLDVQETDLTEAIHRAPAGGLVVDVRALKEKLAEGSFDVVVGESMIHQAKGNDALVALENIRFVLRAGGIFLHVQDALPDPSSLVEEKSRSSPAEGAEDFSRRILARGSAILASGDELRANHDRVVKLALEGHVWLMQRMGDLSSRLGLPFAAAECCGSAVVNPEDAPQRFGEIDLRGRPGLEYRYGLAGEIKDPDLPKDKVTLRYTLGVIAIRKAGSVRQYLELVDKIVAERDDS